MQAVGFKKSRISKDAYFEWRIERAMPAVKKIQKIKRLKDKKVLDVGCGYGSLTYLLLQKGANVFATEIDAKKLAFAKKKLADTKSVSFTKVSDELLPFGDNSFDVVTLFDVIEHVNHPGKMLDEVKRVLKPRGIVYVEFTPFYSVTGHHLYDFTKLPIHLFAPERIKPMIYKKHVDSFNSKEDFWELYRSLNKLKISRFQEMVRDMHKIEEKFIVKYPDVISVNLPFLNFLGPLKDFFTMSFEGIYQKKNASFGLSGNFRGAP